MNTKQTLKRSPRASALPRAHGLAFTEDSVRAFLNTAIGTYPARPIDTAKPYKGQTRRVIVPPPTFSNMNLGKRTIQLLEWNGEQYGSWTDEPESIAARHLVRRCKYQVGDTVWARETWWNGASLLADACIFFDDPRLQDARANQYRKRSSRFMPRALARLEFEIMRVRVESVNQISHEDAIAEGLPVSRFYPRTHAIWSDFLGKWSHYQYWYDFQRKAWRSGNMGYHDTDTMDGRAWCNYFSWQDSFQTLWDSLNAKRGYAWDMNPLVFVLELKRTK